jgi:hypothetical protein
MLSAYIIKAEEESMPMASPFISKPPVMDMLIIDKEQL